MTLGELAQELGAEVHEVAAFADLGRANGDTRVTQREALLIKAAWVPGLCGCGRCRSCRAKAED